MNIHNAHQSMQFFHEKAYASALAGLNEVTHELVRRVEHIKDPDSLESDMETLVEKTRQLNRTTRAILARMPE